MPVGITKATAYQQALQLCLHRKLNFAAYRLPGGITPLLVIQKKASFCHAGAFDHDLPSNGFLIAPFSRDDGETCLIKPHWVLNETNAGLHLEEISRMPVMQPPSSLAEVPEDTGREQYLSRVASALDKIRSGSFEKVVLSRVKSMMGSFEHRLSDIFTALCDTYPTAFVYLFCLNGVYWTGATPEPFICSEEDNLYTVSLAGTRPYKEEGMDLKDWNHKEILEQEYVSRHIEKVLKQYQVDQYRRQGPYTVKAGNLIHLRTDFSFPLATIAGRLPLLLQALHPTPAVCGMSTGQAMDFIRNTEKHNREYYTGFLGPLGISGKLQLYVNLRCMKVLPDRLLLYIGGGITAESAAEEEWEETEIKADTLLTVLNRIV